MNSNFECFVEICDQKYEMVVKGLGFVFKFIEIYPKIQQMVKIGLKEDINFITHKFEVMQFMSLTNEWSLVKSAEQLIKQKSRFRIRKNLQELIDYSMAYNQSIDEQIVIQLNQKFNYLLENKRRIEIYHSIVMAINIGWDLLSTQNWTKVENQFKVRKPLLNFKYSVLKNEFQHWTTFYTKNYLNINGKVGPKSQRIFNLLKVIHVLDFEKVFYKSDPISKQLTDISLFPSLKYFYNKFLINIRVEKILTKEMKNSGKQTNDKQSQNTINQNSSDSTPQISTNPHISIPSFPENRNRFVTSVNNQNNHSFDKNSSFIRTHNTTIPFFPIPSNGYQTHRINIPFIRTQNLTNDYINISLEERLLFEEKNEIMSYSFMAYIIKIGWNLRRNDKNNWMKVSHLLWKHYRKMLSPLLCLENFHRWTEYYAKNYNKLNGRLQPNAQKIFDLLKLVHILDLDKFYDNTSHIPKQIRKIWLNSELQNYYRKYLRQIHFKKYKEMESISIHLNQNQMTTLKEQTSCNSVNKKVAQTPSASQSSSTSNCFQTIQKTYERDSQNRSGQSSQTLDKNNYNVSSTNNSNQSQSTRFSYSIRKRIFEELQTLRSDNNSNFNKKTKTK